MKMTAIAILTVGLLAGAALAQQPSSQGAPANPPVPKAAQPGSAAGQTASKGTGRTGQLAAIDKEKHSLTLSSASGGTQEVKVADGAIITRDGAAVSIDQLKAGDQVRASFDPATNQATTLEVKSSKKM